MSKIFGQASKAGHQDAEHWMSTSDLMAGLMMVFLFISIAFMRYVMIEQERIKEVAVAYQDTQVAIYDALMQEFGDDLSTWNASINRDSLSFEFQSPEVLFAVGSIELRTRFQEILQDFFPRYLEVLRDYRASIDEVRIEGHTSSDWDSVTDETNAYFMNMILSQGRTRTVLQYVYSLIEAASPDREWVRTQVAAVGFSSSRLVLNEQGAEDPERSRRVTFRVITNAETQIRTILEQ
ncbi:MAG: OmpA family protein [Pseudomonadota bacterium]|nr:OmpA family protein [Pseudomonadota bacterium]